MSDPLDSTLLAVTNQDHDGSVSHEEKQHLINNANYALLQQCQQAIAKATDISPSIRKLINDLITTENIEIIKNKLITQFSD